MNPNSPNVWVAHFVKVLFSLFLSLFIVYTSYGQPCVGARIRSTFNGTPIPAGRYIWFNAHISNLNPPNNFDCNTTGFTITFDNSQIVFTDDTNNNNLVDYVLAVPSATITFSNTVTTAITTYNAISGFTTTIPCSGISNGGIFITGLALLVPSTPTSPAGLPGGINPVTWTGNFYSSVPGVQVSWQWAAAVYTSFTTNYNDLGIQVLDGSYQSGTPVNYRTFVTGGARGGGGSNFTGSNSGTQSIVVCDLTPLPVTLIDFNATRSGNKALLTWVTASEHNNKSFFIQQYSKGEWQDIGEVVTQAPSGNSNSALRYSISFFNQEKELGYYRLKQVDLDNTTAYGPIRTLAGYSQKPDIKIYPNPVPDGQVTIQFSQASERDIIVSDLSGRIIRNAEKTTALTWRSDKFATGFYIITVTDKNNGSVFADRLIVK